LSRKDNLIEIAKKICSFKFMPIFEVTSAYSFTHAVYPCACDVVNINAAAEKLRMR